MTQEQHTPGPWYLDIQSRDDNGTRDYIVRGAPGSAGNPNLGPWIARLNDYRTMRDGTADANLIAAAPELLAVAQGCLGYFEYMAAQGSDFTPDAAWLAPLRAAIAKATGNA